jgi:hypothetical protein
MVQAVFAQIDGLLVAVVLAHEHDPKSQGEAM